MGWPTANDYLEAVQHPPRRFSKPELKRSQALADDDGKPLAYRGKYADVYQLQGPGGMERWAIACFTQEPKGQARRYRLINDYLQRNHAPFVVETEYVEQGISVRGRWYPVTRSHWVDGVKLNEYVREHLDNPTALRALASAWLSLSQKLRRVGMAHGNLWSDTVLVEHDSDLAKPILRLVDYEAVFIPALAESPPEEFGHADCQHPQRAWQKYYGPDADRFSQLVVYTALHAVAALGRGLWERFDKGHNFLFTATDFQEPGTAAIFQELWRSTTTQVRTLAGHLILAAQGAVGEVPPLEQVADTPLSPTALDRIAVVLREKPNFAIPVEDAVDDEFAIVVEDEPVPPVVQPAAPTPPPMPALKTTPPPMPAPIFDPRVNTYMFEAWMPEQVAVMKLQGFVRDACGEIVQSVPGHIRMHMTDQLATMRAPGATLLGWLGLMEQPPDSPKVLAVVDLYLVHKQELARQRICITVEMTPGPGEDPGPRWKPYCDRAFVELRAYMIGTQ
jgi:hypothetical protein